jgi:prepilin-type N-terminal cleavage/methylation domain-containing protein
MNSHAKGFTLLEIIISVVLLSFISVFVAQSIQSGLKARAKIQKDIDRTVGLRESINIISRDIQLAFNYRDINIKLYNAAIKERCKTPATVTPPPAGGAAPPPVPPAPPAAPAGGLPPEQCQQKTEKTYSMFIGESDKLDFTALSNVRTRRDDFTSDQAEVGYELKRCKARLTGADAGNCLWRRVSPVVDDDVTKGGTESVLIENVKSLTFRYLSSGTDGEWQKIWSSDGKSDTTKAGKFPLAVEVTLQIYDKQFTPPKEIGMTAVAPLRFPNNPEDEPGTGAAGNAPTSAPTP